MKALPYKSKFFNKCKKILCKHNIVSVLLMPNKLSNNVRLGKELRVYKT